LPVIKAIGPAAIDAAPQIIEHLKADYTVSATSDALLAMGPETLPLLANALRSDRFSPDKNRIFLKLLARFGADAASTVPTIIPHMTSRYPRVREAAARALGAIGSQPELSLPALGQAIGDPRPFVRAAAAESLAAFPDNAAETVPQLANALSDEYLDVRVAAATALGLLGEAAMPALPELNQLAHDPNLLIREMAREAVDRISQP
jgi:HEAT repeat protein